MTTKTRNILIKPIKLDVNNRQLNQANVKKLAQGEGQSNTQKQEDTRDSDCSSVSSIESDAAGFNIWDNSELRLRGIDPEELTDFYGKRLSFLQIFKIRSSFYRKNQIPTQSEIFKEAEKIYRFCCLPLKLDEFLDEDRQNDLVQINLPQDKNFVRFTRYFEHSLELNSLKYRAEKYDRYNAVEREEIARKNQLVLGNKSTVIHSLGLSPRKPPKIKGISEPGLKKNEMNIHQLDEMHRKEKNLMQPLKVPTLPIENEDENNISILKERYGSIDGAVKGTNPASFTSKPTFQGLANTPSHLRIQPVSSQQSQKPSPATDNTEQKQKGLSQHNDKKYIVNASSNSPIKKSTTMLSGNFSAAANAEMMNLTLRQTPYKIQSQTLIQDQVKLPSIQQSGTKEKQISPVIVLDHRQTQSPQKNNRIVSKQLIPDSAGLKPTTPFQETNGFANFNNSRISQHTRGKTEILQKNPKRYYSTHQRDAPKQQ